MGYCFASVVVLNSVRLSHADKQLNRIGLPPRIRTQISWSVATCLFQLDEQEIKWGQGRDSNPRPSGYEPDELPTAPPCDIKSKEVMAVEGYKSSIYSTRTPYSSVAPLAPSIDYRGCGGTRNQPQYDTQHVCLSLLGYLLRPDQAVGTLLLLLSVGQKFSPTVVEHSSHHNRMRSTLRTFGGWCSSLCANRISLKT